MHNKNIGRFCLEQQWAPSGGFYFMGLKLQCYRELGFHHYGRWWASISRLLHSAAAAPTTSAEPDFLRRGSLALSVADNRVRPFLWRWSSPCLCFDYGCFSSCMALGCSLSIIPPFIKIRSFLSSKHCLITSFISVLNFSYCLTSPFPVI